MVCDTIKSLRETAGLSQSALAKRLGVTRSSVNAWEMGLSIPTAQYIVISWSCRSCSMSQRIICWA